MKLAFQVLEEDSRCDTCELLVAECDCNEANEWDEANDIVGGKIQMTMEDL